MNEQVGLQAFFRHLREESTRWPALLPQLPRLAHRTLAQAADPPATAQLAQLLREQKRQTRLLKWLVVLLTALLGLQLALVVL